MESDIKILKLLIGNKGERFTIKKISETLKINYRIAHERVISLEKEGLIKITNAGNSRLCEFTDMFSKKVYEAEDSRRLDLFMNKDFLVLYNRLAELNFCFIALLFGSHAKKTADRHSDIDILTIGGDEKEIRSALSLLPDKIHLTSINYENFMHMAKTREFTVVSEALKNSIIIIGIEDYYRLLKHRNSTILSE